MQKLLIIAIVVSLGWYGYGKYQTYIRASTVKDGSATAESLPLSASPATGAVFRCDGRTYCSQMTSCAEATYFLNNCPGTKMDGDHDGIPCEKQWCK